MHLIINILSILQQTPEIYFNSKFSSITRQKNSKFQVIFSFNFFSPDTNFSPSVRLLFDLTKNDKRMANEQKKKKTEIYSKYVNFF